MSSQSQKKYIERSAADILRVVDRFVEYYDLMHHFVDQGLIVSSLDRGAFVRPQDLLPDSIMQLLGPKRNSHSYAYGPEAGDKDICVLLAKNENRKFETNYSETNIAIVPGAWAGVQLSLEELFRVGRNDRYWDRNILAVIGPTHYQLFHRSINVCGIDVRGFDFVVDGQQHTPESLLDITEILSLNPHAIFLTNPSNPDGLFLNRTFVKDLVKYCEEKGIFVIIDEINNFLPMNGVSDDLYSSWIQRPNVIRIDSYSKKRALAEYRMGWVIADQKILGTRTTGLIGRLSGFIGNAPRAANTAIIKLLEIELAQNENVFILKWDDLIRKRKYILDRLATIKGIQILMPDTCMNICIKMPLSTGQTDFEIAHELMKRGTLIMPAAGYGYEQEARVMRITAAERDEKIEHALNAIESLIKQTSIL